jgi:hypothetical protein
MRSAPKLSIACMALVLVLGACSDTFGGGEVVRGSGTIIAETRPVSGFDEVVILGSGDIFIDITGTESLELETDDNLVPLITTEVVGGRLELSVVPDTNLDPSRDIVFTITAAELTAITILGSADIEVTSLDSPGFEVTVNGSGNVIVAGTTERLDVTINGSGDFAGEDLVATIAEATVNGSGSIVINATEEVTGRIAGSGDIRYLGDPVVDVAVTGSGSVSPG